MADYDLLLKDGIVVDGTRSQRYRADVGIRDGRIATHRPRSRSSDGAARPRRERPDRRARASSTCTPTTTRSCSGIRTCTLSGWHGVTSVVIGNCGFGFAPVRPEMRERAMLTMTRVEAIPLRVDAAGPAVGLGHVSRVPRQRRPRTPKAVNVLPYVPVAPLLIWVLGFERAKAGEHADRRRARASSAGCSTRRWTPAAAAGRRSVSIPTAPAPCSATTTAARWSPT